MQAVLEAAVEAVAAELVFWPFQPCPLAVWGALEELDGDVAARDDP